MKANSVLDTIGHTPHIRINRLFGNTHQVWIKSERTNPGGSIKLNGKDEMREVIVATTRAFRERAGQPINPLRYLRGSAGGFVDVAQRTFEACRRLTNQCQPRLNWVQCVGGSFCPCCELACVQSQSQCQQVCHCKLMLGSAHQVCGRA